jgi:RNA polymerase sigma-70 factor (ECF subfamily)
VTRAASFLVTDRDAAGHPGDVASRTALPLAGVVLPPPIPRKGPPPIPQRTEAAAVDDAVQDVFIVVHRRLTEFEGRSSLRSWLFGIARRVAHDHRRRIGRKERGEELPEVLPDPDGSTPAGELERAQAVRTLHALLAALDDDKREVFILAELEQMTAPEIAAALGVNLNTVYSRLRAARAAFDAAVARHLARNGGGR